MEVLLGLLAAFGSLAIAAVHGSSPWLAKKLIRKAADKLPAECCERYEEEWLAELEELADGGIAAVLWAGSVYFRARVMRRVLEDLAQTVTIEQAQNQTTAQSQPDLSNAVWHGSMWRGRRYANVQVAFVKGYVAVRDGKDPDGPVLILAPHEWDAFLRGARLGEFDME